MNDTVTPAAIRAWARSCGLDVGVRGRISADVRRAYQAQHPAVPDVETLADVTTAYVLASSEQS